MESNHRNAILGWMIGDALGVTTEFQSSKAAKKMVEDHDDFNSGLVGNNVCTFCPGEFTDDTEMGLAILSVLIEKHTYQQEDVAKMYHKWYRSNPKDIGNATANCVKFPTALEMTQAAKRFNSESMSNGFLMRIPPLIAHYVRHNIPSKYLAVALEEDLCLTHCHPDLLAISKHYANILTLAIRTRDQKTVFNYAMNQTNKGHDLIDVKFEKNSLIGKVHDAVLNQSDVIEWDNKRYFFSDIDGTACGFVLFAYWCLLRCLHMKLDYRNSMLWIAGLGGDADTNCCIAGAVMGALYPMTIPATWLYSVVMNTNSVRYVRYPPSDPKNWITYIN